MPTSLQYKCRQQNCGYCWSRYGQAHSLHRAPETALDKPEHIANGYAYSVTIKAEHGGESIEWQEQRLVVQSLKHAIAQKSLGCATGKGKVSDRRFKQAGEDGMKKGCELLASSAILLFWIDDKLLAEVEKFRRFLSGLFWK